MSYFFNGPDPIVLGYDGWGRPLNLIISYPFSISCWFYPTNNTTTQDLVALSTWGAVDNVYWINLAGNVSGDPIRAQTWNGSQATTLQTTGVRFNQWNHVIARFVANNYRLLNLNGAGAVWNTNNSNQTSQVAARLLIGAGGSNFRPFKGYIAHVGIWNTQCTNVDATSLSKGASPLAVRRQNLVGYWPMVNPGEQINVADAKSRGFNTFSSRSNAGRYSNWNPPVKLLLPQRNRTTVYLASSNTTVAVTGQSATGAVGTVTTVQNVDYTVTGQSATGAVGTPTVELSLTVLPSGVASTGAVGTPEILTPVPSVYAIGAVGQVIVWTPVSPDQNPGWTPVDDSQATDWTPVDDSNTVSWLKVA